MAIAGLRSEPRGVERQSMTSRLVMPVELVGGFLDGNAVDQILEHDLALDFGQHRAGVGIPLGDALAALHLVAVVDEQARTVGQAVRRALLAGLVEDQHRHVAAHHHVLAVRVAHHVAVADLDLAFIRGFEERAVDHLRRAAHVEGAHGELGARLADRLRRDDADGFALVDRGAARQVATVADRADAGPDLAGQRRADADRLDAGLLDLLDVALVHQRAGLDDQIARDRVIDVCRARYVRGCAGRARRPPGRHRRSAAW